MSSAAALGDSSLGELCFDSSFLPALWSGLADNKITFWTHPITPGMHLEKLKHFTEIQGTHNSNLQLGIAAYRKNKNSLLLELIKQIK